MIAIVSMPLLVIFLIIIACLPFLPLAEGGYDLWWHLKVGQLILEHRSLPAVDPFAFVGSSRIWVNHEWLSEVIFASSYAAGWLALLRAMLFIAIALSLLLLVQCYLQRFAPTLHKKERILCALVATAALGVPMLAMFANLRPQTFSLLFFLLTLLLIEIGKRGHKVSFYFAPLLIAIWANLHGGVLLGVLAVLLALPFAKLSLPAAIGCALLSLLALFVQPYGVELLFFFARELTSLHAYIVEWSPPRGAQWAVWALYVLLPLAIVSKRKIDHLFLFHLLLALVTAQHNRMLPFLALVAVPLSAPLFIHLLPKSLRWQRIVIALISLLLLSAAVRPLSTMLRRGIQLSNTGQVLPQGAIGFLRDNPQMKNVIAPIQWGGFLIFSLSPAIRVAIDGRNVTAYEVSYVHKYNTAYAQGRINELVTLAPAADVMLLPRESLAAKMALTEKVFPVLFEDGVSIIFAVTDHSHDKGYD